MKEKIVLGLSGGVDSAVAARLLQEDGFEVLGLFLDIGMNNAAEDAVKVAEYLQIPLKIVDIRQELERNVCAPFAAAYLRGETPNPCIMCNPTVKFKSLIDYADSIGAKYIATGHYAISENGGLFKGHPENDQSYMLCRVKPSQLARLVLPLGRFPKTHVRELAEGMSLPVAKKPDSMEICFIPDGDFGQFIESRGVFPGVGNFVDNAGKVLGQHRGIHRYTIGQRRGLNFAAGKRIFISEIRPETNEIVLSDNEVLMTSEISVRDVNWLVAHEGSFLADVRVRHSKLQTPADVRPCGEDAHVVFTSPVRAPTSGQSAVFYIGNQLVGGGFIVQK